MGPLDIPTNVSVAQFLFSTENKSKAERPWLIDSSTGERFTRTQLLLRCYCLAQMLRSKFDVKPDDVVCIVSGNHVDYATAFWAANFVGASTLVTNSEFSAEELVPQFQAARPSLCIANSDALLSVREACMRSSLDPERIILIDMPSVHVHASLNAVASCPYFTVQDLIDITTTEGNDDFKPFMLHPEEGGSKVAILFPSSGTTGAPKLIAVSHHAFIANIVQAIAHDRAGTGPRRYNPGDVSCAVLPFFHILGFLINLHYPIASEMTVVTVPKFGFKRYVEVIERYRVTHILIVPPILLPFIKDTNYNRSSLLSLRVVAIAGAPLSHVVLEFAKLVPQAVVGQIYGMTESGALTAPSLDNNIPTFDDRLGVATCSVGKLLPGIASRVIREDGCMASRGEKGELWVQTPSAAMGYAGQHKDSHTFNTNGWLRTGDEVYFDENDELYVVQRLKDFMKVKGFRVNPAEIEARMLDHPDVAECCVVPIPHEFNGEVPKAYIVLMPDTRKRLTSREDELILKDTLTKHAAQNRIRYKHLMGGIQFLSSIPKTSSGKSLRRLLRQPYS